VKTPSEPEEKAIGFASDVRTTGRAGVAQVTHAVEDSTDRDSGVRRNTTKDTPRGN